MHRLHSKKLLLFDLDGTLVDTKDVIVESFVLASKKTGVKIDPVKVRKLIGYPLMDVVKNSLLEERDESTVKEFIKVRKEIMESLWRRKARLFEDVIPVLERFSEDENIILGIASSSIVQRIIDMVEYFGIKKYFKIISGVKENVRGKPYPDTILYAIKKAGVGVKDTVYVGDAEIDCIASRNAGVKFVLVKRENIDLREWVCKPHYIIKSLYQLYELRDKVIYK